MVTFFIVVACLFIIVVADWHEDVCKNGVGSSYDIRQNEEGRFFIVAKYGVTSACPKKIKKNDFPTEPEARIALDKFLHEQLRIQETARFSTSIKTEDVRLALEAQLTNQRLQELLDRQKEIEREDRMRDSVVNVAPVPQGTASRLIAELRARDNREKELVQPRKAGRVKV